jgi:hypothetical protein
MKNRVTAIDAVNLCLNVVAINRVNLVKGFLKKSLPKKAF